MKSRISRYKVLPKWSALLMLFSLIAMSYAGGPPKASAPAPAPHAAAPAPHPSTPAARPAGGAGAPNHGPGAQMNRAGAPGGAGAPNHGPGGANTNRGGMNNNANNRGGSNNTNNRPGANNGTNRGGMNNGANRGGANNAGNRAGGAASRHQPAGSRQVALKNGGSATFRKNGQVRSIQSHGMTINHGMHGNTHMTSTHNGRTIVSHGRYGGYSQRAYYSHGGRTYVQRTYYVNGHYYAYGYRSYYYGGYPYYGYAPAYYYGPAYYGWAYNPWPAPVYYGWGWGGAPWYGYYGPYFQPYPVYPTAAFWLTDFLLAASLQAAYQAGQSSEEGLLQPPQMGPETSDVIASLWSTDPLIAAKLEASYGQYMLGAAAPVAGKSSATQIPADVKQGIADEMKNEIAAEQAAAKGGDQKPAGGEEVPAALDPKIRYFVASTDLDATTSDGTECGLTAGDVVYRVGDKPDDDHMVDAVVKASKKDDCAIGATIGVDTSDLQEMHNQLRVQMDAGLKELADKQGKNGLPAAPDTKTQPGEAPAPAPDTNASNDLQQQKTDAAQVEAEAKQSN